MAIERDHRKFAQCELATHGYLKTGVTAILLATLSSGKTLSWGKRVLAIALFSATAFGLATLSSYLPRTGTSSLGMAVAAADPCGDRCGGGGNGQGSYGPDTSGFEPPGMPNQLPDYQSGANSGYPAPDQAVSQVTQQAADPCGDRCGGGGDGQGSDGPDTSGFQPPG